MGCVSAHALPQRPGNAAVHQVEAALAGKLGSRGGPAGRRRTLLDALAGLSALLGPGHDVLDELGRHVTPELGEDHPRVDGEGPDPRLPIARVELHGEEHVGRLGLSVADEFVVVAPLEVDVVEVHAAEPVRAGAQIDDPRWRTGSKRRQQQKGQKKVT